MRCAQASGCGRLEPAYEIAGDAFDYALNDRWLDAAKHPLASFEASKFVAVSDALKPADKSSWKPAAKSLSK